MSSPSYHGVQSACFPIALVSQICQCFRAFHWPAHGHSQPVSASHYCSHTRKGIFQYLIYDSNSARARLLGV
ncbi:hypothetical protein K437DRAFT_255660 [Tilletiaria anomala UBC 951]|uniref:Uncharacterized protein n=1 Tax=Tilletiaria anomala (strain ATCC 24038 / CBS 436.72 / UBC 951) TaxID=1037660 RepID=A0A066W3C7_TILAU|nr:uncharacterized protein K437DRAFT_255660 [Tilletiaria anomala UBC 951]KDN48226.1 hypothetical protein K437DRAFT_255660 [Tilletiaria anomala UBC 951]